MHRRHRFFWKSLLSLLIAAIWLAGSFIPSYADVAPPPPPDGFTILPGSETTQVRMMYENVFMNINADGVAKVDANFVMRNLGNQAESMEVRFPLYSSDKTQREPGKLSCGFFSTDQLAKPPITDLAVWVWDKPQSVKTTYEKMAKGYSAEEVDVPCWGVFMADFPPGLDVPIEVKYTSPDYTYILTTGAGWKGTIGQADIAFRLPYDVIQGQNLEQCFPESCIVKGREIQWQFLDFEPTDNISVTIAEPSAWWRILTETNNLKLNPKDALALKRLAIAYKDSAVVEKAGRGYDEGAANRWRYQMSLDAFRKADRLFQGDADFHFQYAELICTSAEWDSRPSASVDLAECLQQLKLVLEFNPKHEMALYYLRLIWPNPAGVKIAGMEELQSKYIQLTPTVTPDIDFQASPLPMQPPSSSLQPSATPTLSPAAQTPAATLTPSLAIQPTATPAFTLTPLSTPPTPRSSPAETGSGSAWLWLLIPLAALLALWAPRRRGGR